MRNITSSYLSWQLKVGQCFFLENLQIYPTFGLGFSNFYPRELWSTSNWINPSQFWSTSSLSGKNFFNIEIRRFFYELVLSAFRQNYILVNQSSINQEHFKTHMSYVGTGFLYSVPYTRTNPYNVSLLLIVFVKSHKDLSFNRIYRAYLIWS